MKQQFTRISLPIDKRLPLTANPVSIAAIPGNGFLLNFKDSPQVWKLSAELELIWNKPLAAQSRDHVNCSIAVSPDGKYLALCSLDAVRILDDSGKELYAVVHQPWAHFQGSHCGFSTEKGSLLMWFVTPGSASDSSDLLQVMLLPGFAILDTYPLEVSETYNYTFHNTPDPGKLIIALVAGQEEGKLYQVSLEEDAIEVVAIGACKDGIMGNFAPSGKEWVTAPHYEEGIELFSFPAMEPLATLEQEALFEGRNEYPTEEDEDSVDYRVFYLNDVTLLAFTRFGRLLLIDRESLNCTGELSLEDCTIRAYDFAGRPTEDPDEIIDYAGEIIEVHLTPRHELLITHSSGEIRLYRLPEHFTV